MESPQPCNNTLSSTEANQIADSRALAAQPKTDTELPPIREEFVKF